MKPESSLPQEIKCEKEENDEKLKSLEISKVEFLKKKEGTPFKTKPYPSIVVTNSLKNIEEITCSICLDYIIGCKIAICGHSFCDFCISECLIRKKVSFFI
jgi:hypothetical protein